MSAALHLQGVFQHVRGHRVLEAVELRLEPGECLLLLGPNGAGKSLLLRLILGLERPSAGRIERLGVPASGDQDADLKGVGMVFQGSSLLGDLTVVENILLPLRGESLNQDDLARRARLAMTRLHLDGLENHYPDELSGGLRRQVELARALIRTPKLLLMDEPTDGLDTLAQRELLGLLRQEQELRGLTVLLASHALKPMIELADRVALLDSGRLLADCPASELPALLATRPDLSTVLGMAA